MKTPRAMKTQRSVKSQRSVRAWALLALLLLTATSTLVAKRAAANEQPFLRGDVDGDGRTTMADAIGVLEFLFRSGSPGSCLDALDADDNGLLEATDSIRILSSLFAGGPALPAPSPACGLDGTPDSLGCDRFPGCLRPLPALRGGEARGLAHGVAPGGDPGAAADSEPAAELAAEGSAAPTGKGEDRCEARLSGRESTALPGVQTGRGAAVGAPIAFGEVVTGEITSFTQVDVYSFAALRGQRVSVDLLSATSANVLNWKVEDAWGRIVASNLATLQDLGPMTLLGGDYALSIFPEATTGSAYSFRVVEAADAAPRPIALNETVSDGIDPDHPGQRDVYTFTAGAGQRVFLDLLSTSNGVLNWRLEDAFGRQLVATRRVADVGPISLTGGDYRLVVEGPVGTGVLQTGTYSLRVVGVEEPAAIPLTLGEVVSGAIERSGEVNRYTFSASPGQVVFFDTIASSSGGALNYELRDEVGRAVVARTTSFFDIGPVALVGGEYEFRLLAEGGEAPTYQFRITDATPASAVAVSLGDVIDGEVPADHPGVAQRYSFTAPASSSVTLELIQSSNTGSLDYQIEDAQGRAVLARTTSLSTVGPIALLGGAYTLSVLPEAGATGTFRFRLRDDGPASYTPTGTPISLDTVIDAAVGTPGGEERYTLSLAGAARVYFDLLAGHPDLDWQLLDPMGRSVQLLRANSIDSSDLGPYPLAAGTYTLVLRARIATATPAFQFRTSIAPVTTSLAAVGDVISGDFAGLPGAVHKVTFDVAEGQRIFLDRLIASVRLDWKLVDPAGTDVFPLRRGDGVDNDEGPFTLDAGTYTLVLDPEFGYQPAYELAIRDVRDLEATVMPGEVVSGSFSGAPGSTRRFLIGAASGERLFFDRITVAARLDWSLLDPVGELVFGPVNANSQDSDQGPFALAAGVYTLVLDPQAGQEPTFDFRVISLTDSTLPLQFGVPTAGAITVGATHAYEFQAVEGQRVLFDLQSAGPFLRWSLLDEVGEAIVKDASATPTADLGPYNLAQGTYRLELHGTTSNTPAYGFTALNMAADLVIDELYADERVFFEGERGRDVVVSWWGRNAGGGPGVAPPAIDRLVLSSDTVVGNGDDILLGDFIRYETLAPHAVYARTARVELPDSLAIGTYRIFVILDAANAVEEPAGETNNVGTLELQVVGDLPPAQPGVVDSDTFAFSFAANGTSSSLDIPLARPVALDSIRNVHTDALSLAITGPVQVVAANVTMSLLSGRDEVLEVGSVSPYTERGTATFVARLSRRLSPQTVALLPRRSVDGVRFRVEQASSSTLTVKPVSADQILGVHFVGCEFAPCGPHLERRSPGEEGITFVGTGVSEWNTVTFDEPVPGDELRFVSGPSFSVTVLVGLGVAAATSEAQLILDDGALVTLDDSRSPSTLQTPAFLSISRDHSLALGPDALAGRQILGFQWRVHAASAGLGSATAIYVPDDELAVRFLYDVESCQGSIAIPPVDLEPPSGAAFAPGSTVTLSGRALPPQAGRPVSAVLINGESVDSLDGAGRFFKTVRIEEGDNLFAIEVVEPGCGGYEALLTLLGLPDGVSGLDGYAEADAQLRVEYADTTFRRATSDLLVKARARNVSQQPVRGPILMVLSGLQPPSVVARAAAGVTEQGEPYVVLLQEGLLAPGAASPYVTLPFGTPELLRVHFEPRWLVPSNRPPHFESAPASRAVAGSEYRYDADAADIDGDAVRYRLDFGPTGMSVDPDSGVVMWSPGAADVGSHEVSLSADDGVGGQATQRWTLTVASAAANRPPYFATTPVLSVAVGGLYVYGARAVDPDGDAVIYTLAEAPGEVVLDSSTGELRWSYALVGQHTISIEARDGAGSSSLQSFVLSVGSTPSNASAPRITTAPSTEAVAGVLFIYQPVVSEPDGDLLTYTLDVGPEGMTIRAGTGRIEWTPRLDQVGSHAVEISVADGRGGETSQRFTLVVTGDATNLPPVIESVPSGFALVGQPYSYDVDAIDPEGEALVFSVLGAPAGMTIDAHSGVLEWTPQAGDVGAHVLTVRATDARGSAGNQAYELRVRASNAIPSITSSAPRSQVLAGTTWQHDLDARDDDGDLLRYELASGPAALTVQPITGLATWRTTAADVGLHPVVLRVVDCCGGAVELPFSIEVLADTEPPVVEVGFSANPAAVGAVVQVAVAASDNAGVASRSLSVECPPAAPRALRLDELGRASFSSPVTGYCIFTATVTDPSGNETVASSALQVGNPDDPLDPHPPVVTILSPLPGTVITAVTDVAATIADATEAGMPGSGPFTWSVELAPSGSAAFESLGSGGGLVSGAVLTRLDPTLLPNGTYRVRITGSDGVQTGGVEYEVSVAGDLKLGNYTMAFADLVLPLAGLPIVVSRQYSSFDPSPGDFGAGWRLGLPGKVEDSAMESSTGNGLVDLLAAEPFHPGTRVYVTLSDGRRVGFTFQPRNAGGLLAYINFPELQADPGVEETLEVLEPAGSFFLFGGNASQVGVPYNPTTYRLTTKEGVRYVIHELSGLQQIEDPAGNTIDVREDGLFSSTGVAVTFERDAAGRITRIVEPEEPGDPDPPGELHYLYDEATGNLTAFLNQEGEEVRYFYESAAYPNYITRLEDPLGGTPVRTVLDAEGRIVAQCGPGGNVSTLEGCTSYDYDAVARVQTIFDAVGGRRDIFFDELGNAVTERIFLEDSSFLDTSFEYDEGGHMTRWILPGGARWTYTYDDRGNLTSVTDPAGRARRYTYTECDLVDSEEDALGASQRFDRDASCNLSRITSPLGHVTTFGRDSIGNLREILEATGDRWQFTHDDNGRPSGSTDPLGHSSTSTINQVGELRTVIDRNGERIDYAYDEAHRLVSETWATTPPRTTTYTRNDAGQLVGVSDPDSVLSFTYHPTGLLASVDNAGTPGAPRVVVDYEYDANGRLTAVRDSLGGATTYRYDSVGRLVSSDQSGAGVSPKRIDFEYDLDSRIAQIGRHGDLQAATLAAATTFGYDTPGDPRRLSRIEHGGPGGVPIETIDLVRDAVGNITRLTDVEGLHSYTYDGFGGLLATDHPATGAQSDERYAYDGVGNRTSSHLSASYTLSSGIGLGGHRLVQDDRFDYDYDSEGNLLRRTDRSTGAATTFTWDLRGRLTVAARLANGGALLEETRYVYDAMNRRIRITRGGVATHIVHDGGNPILELATGGSVLVRRLYGRALDEVYAEEIGGTTRWLLTDQVGTVRDVVADDGTVLAHHVYDSFGRRLQTTGDASATTLGFQGRPLDATTGLLHLRAREYDPETGRFISEDSLEPYRYGFAFNNPLIYTDPSGRSVAIEYACLAIQAVFFGWGFYDNIAKPVGALYFEIAEALETLTTPSGAGVTGVGNGLVGYLGGFAPIPTTPKDIIDPGKINPAAVFCAEKGASDDVARAQGAAAGGGPSGFSWSGPSWSKY